MGLRFAPGVAHRASKRGLVLAVPDVGTLLFEHPRADLLPELLGRTLTMEELAAELAPPLDPKLLEEMMLAGVLIDDSSPLQAGLIRPGRAVSVTPSGILVPGIYRPARWLERRLSPLVGTSAGRVVLAIVVASGLVALARGRPTSAAPTQPAAQALVLMAMGLVLTVAHELGHAVAMVRFGVRPQRAGFGFYWGALSFFVDSSPALVLNRRERMVQALAGLGVDVVATATLALLATCDLPPLVRTTCWQLAVLGAVSIVVNGAPILEVDGHLALSDYLDEPELAPRARSAFADALHGRRPAQP